MLSVIVEKEPQHLPELHPLGLEGGDLRLGLLLITPLRKRRRRLLARRTSVLKRLHPMRTRLYSRLPPLNDGGEDG